VDVRLVFLEEVSKMPHLVEFQELHQVLETGVAIVEDGVLGDHDIEYLHQEIDPFFLHLLRLIGSFLLPNSVLKQVLAQVPWTHDTQISDQESALVGVLH
jgi:hypothetical protein